MKYLVFILLFFMFFTEAFAYVVQSNEIANTELNIKPRRKKFKRQRLGSQTLLGEAGYFMGYYEGMRYSFNYDGILQSDETNALTIRLGIGYSQATNDSTVFGQEVFIPISIHLLMGVKNHFDLGLGGYYFENRKVITPFIFIGFRHQNPKGGFAYRIGADIHLERVYDLKGRNLQKTAIFGPLIALGWSF